MSILPPRREGPGSAFLPRSTFLVVVNLAVALIVAGIGFGLGFLQGLKAQVVILYTAISIAVLFWLGNYIAVVFENRHLPGESAEGEAATGAAVSASRGCGPATAP